MKKSLFVLFVVFFIGQKIQAQDCTCSPTGWQPFSKTNGTLDSMTVNCGFQFGIRKNNPTILVGKYICPENCVAKYSAVLKNIATGDLVQDYPEFTFPWNYTFTIAGIYKLEITPIFGDKKCQSCVFYFTVN